MVEKAWQGSRKRGERKREIVINNFIVAEGNFIFTLHIKSLLSMNYTQASSRVRKISLASINLSRYKNNTPPGEARDAYRRVIAITAQLVI
tara:strand:- start:973 stop:1245 length:273 start_codon:yes stop_codon:yes gene_type:complete